MILRGSMASNCMTGHPIGPQIAHSLLEWPLACSRPTFVDAGIATREDDAESHF